MGPKPNQQDESKPTVLVIDDSVDVHRLLRARLKHEDLQLVAASTGAEGLSMAMTIEPAIILLDLDMPEIDGFEVLRRLKNTSQTVNIPVIVLSGLHGAQDKVAAFDLGAVDYITKPFNLTELRVRVRAALRLYQLVQMLAQRAQIDGLTGLWNRVHFDNRWADEVSGAGRHSRKLSLALIDLDHFKSINDSFGHPAGDAVLQGIARTLQRECRQEDIACRYGGEEFALIMPDTDTEQATIVCDRVLSAIAAIEWPRHPDRQVTASIGLAGASMSPGLTPEQWLELADKVLYAAKNSGRNRMCVRRLDTPAPMAEAG